LLLKELQKLTSGKSGLVREEKFKRIKPLYWKMRKQGGDARVSSAQSDAATTAPPSREAGSARAAHLLFVRRVLFPRAARHLCRKAKNKSRSAPEHIARSHVTSDPTHDSVRGDYMIRTYMT